MELLCAFVDESERNEEYYFLGALVGTETQIRALSDDLDKILIKNSTTFPGLSIESEFHGYEMMAGKGTWRKIPLRARFGIYHAALQAISDSGVALYIEGIDVKGLSARAYRYPKPPREVAFSYILERVNEEAVRKQTTATVVADDHHTAAQSRSDFTTYQAWGTFGYRSSKLQAISQNVEFIDSKSSRALQAADLATYLYNRRRSHREENEKAHAEKVLMWHRLTPAISRGRARIWP